MLREIKTDKNMLELNSHGNYGFPFYLLYVTLSSYPSGSFNCHWHPELEFMYVLEGTMTYQINHDHYTLVQGDFLFVNTNALHSGSMCEKSDCNYIVATFNPSLVYGYEKSDIDTNYTFPLLNTDAFFSFVSHEGDLTNKHFKDIMYKLGTLYVDRSPCFELHIKSCLCELWSLLFTEYVRCHTTSSIGGAEVRQISRLKNALQFIHNNYTETLTLDEMASACHTSKSEFCRIFKKTLHQTPFEYLLRYRVQKSLPLLAADAHTVTEIANDVGFSGSSYYSEVFRKYMNCSPSEYKKNLMNK